MKQLLIIESPLQLLNAYEAIFHFGISEGILLVRYSGFDKNDGQIDDIIRQLNFPEFIAIHRISIQISNRNIWDYAKVIIQKIKFSSVFQKFDAIYVGNYDSPFIKLIIGNNKNLILLDDGSKTIGTQENFSDSFHFDWFTFFDLNPYKGQKIYKNTFGRLQEITTTSKSKNENIIIFIGSNLSEDKIISEAYYLELIQKISKRYSNQHIIYIPHRSEYESKLNTISLIGNIEIKQLDFPIELLPLYNQSIPTQIISFYSTALFTLGKIYGVPSTAFKFNYHESQYKGAIDDVYIYFEKYMTVIEESDI